MEETIATISKREWNAMYRQINRLNIKLEKLETLQHIEFSEQEAADYMGVKINSFKNLVSSGRIPVDSYFVLLNGERKFYKDKLVKRK